MRKTQRDSWKNERRTEELKKWNTRHEKGKTEYSKLQKLKKTEIAKED